MKHKFFYDSFLLIKLILESIKLIECNNIASSVWGSTGLCHSFLPWYDKIKCSKLSLSSFGKFLTSEIYLLTISLESIAFPTKDLWFDLDIDEPRFME